MIDLRDLLKHEILDLYSAEEQIIEGLPKMIEKANNADLKKALRDHLKVTEQQKDRLDKVKQFFGEEDEGNQEKKGFFSRLFGGSGGEKCKGTEGLIKEGEKMMGEDMSPEVMDAAIIASAQKIEHYEISGYGTAAAYARQLGMQEVERLLTTTLDEEYLADDSLTILAVGRLNIKAEAAISSDGSEAPRGIRSRTLSKQSSNNGSASNGSAKKGSASKTASSTKGGSSKGSASKSSSSKASANKSASKSSTASNRSKGSAKKAMPSKTSPSKGSKISGNKSTAKKGKSSAGKGKKSSSKGRGK
ncbi:MAG: ferritin-like domain-containing protein [Chitinophagaceae bacterium]|nr:ferritin-like domain-containing protein [Chitinophagaceae bacterium]